MATIKGILILSPFFTPNIGGVESHLDDLVYELNRHKIKSFVLTYSPLTTNTPYLSKEKRELCNIIRFPWFGYQLFPRLEKYPLLEFIYLTPYLFIRSFFWLLFNKHKISIIHSHGLNAAFIGNILAFIFNKKHLCSTHAVYENVSGISEKITKHILSNCHKILCLSNASINQLKKWGVNEQKISLYRYWINLKKFIPSKKTEDFKILFVGRLIVKKGIRVILKTASLLPNQKFIIVGNGPLENEVKNFSLKHKNITFLGAIEYTKLPKIYQMANIFCIASQYPEGFGRVLMEAVASGLPVIGSNMGAIPEALDNSVSILFKPTTKNFITHIKSLTQNKNIYDQLQKNCRPYAQKKFSNKNFDTFLTTYQKLLDIDQS